MSNLPRIIGQIIFNGSIILGRAFAEAGKQAIRNARSGEAATAAAATSSHRGGDGAGVGAGSGDSSHALTRAHRMTLQEALMILNLKPDAASSRSPAGGSGGGGAFPRTEAAQSELLKRYEHLFKTNAPPAPKGADPSTGGQGSFYIQSKIVRARERIEAEWEAFEALRNPKQEGAEQGSRDQGPGSSGPPPSSS